MKNFILKINRALAGKKKLFYFLLAAGMMMASCGDSNEPAFDNIGTLKGKFTVDDKGTQVQFSRGNLQYQASTKTWRFAEYQWEVCGKEANEAISPTNSGWIDLFGWGSGDFPFLSSREYNDYSVFTDWSKKAISNGGKKENL